MRPIILILLATLSCQADLQAQNKRDIYDGPYISMNESGYEVEWIEKGRVKRMQLPGVTDTLIKIASLPEVQLSAAHLKPDTVYTYNGVDRLAAISDVHGQYDVMRNLLEVHGVVDSTGQWSFGEGHLVVLGDLFDRGDKVTECLWFLFNLEQEAALAGGKVHVMLGNHELMVLHGDRTYVNPKYIYTGGKLDRNYSELFDSTTILGRWLRAKNVTVSINEFVFVHGGFSKKVLEREQSLDYFNRAFRDTILPDASIGKTGSAFMKDL